jgi:hypothetical protein
VEETRRVEEVLARMIFQAGVDYECVIPLPCTQISVDY